MHHSKFRPLIALAATLSTILLAESGPKQIEVTYVNASTLGFELLDHGVDVQGGIGSRSVTLKFPSAMHDGWPAIRVQTFLLDQNGEELTGTSADFEVASDVASVLAHYQPDKYDLAIFVQYIDKDCISSNCSERYEIQSVNQFVEHLGDE